MFVCLVCFYLKVCNFRIKSKCPECWRYFFFCDVVLIIKQTKNPTEILLNGILKAENGSIFRFML